MTFIHAPLIERTVVVIALPLVAWLNLLDYDADDAKMQAAQGGEGVRRQVNAAAALCPRAL
jgi:hypothetical protein